MCSPGMSVTEPVGWFSFTLLLYMAVTSFVGCPYKIYAFAYLSATNSFLYYRFL